jgi:hypothetical protein
MLIDEVQSFARDFINFKEFRTSGRKAKIREAYTILTGEKIKVSCSTCYIEALLLIVNSKPMATRNYELKKGVLLEAFGDASKTCTNDTITDEIGDWYMKNQPEKIIYFERVRSVPPPAPNPKITIIPPVEKPVEKDMATEMIEQVMEPKKRQVKAKK